MTDEYDPNIIWKVTLAALDTDDPDALARAAGMPVDRFQELCKAWEPLSAAIAAAGQRKALNGISEMIDDETREAWAMVSGADADKKQAALIAMANGGEVQRQRLFLQGCMESYFDVPRVCKLMNIGKKTLDNWNRSPEFREMLSSIQWAKAQFAESMLFKLVAQGSERAVLEANKSLNRETYGDKLELSGQINHAHAVISIDALDLPLETRLTIMEATRKAGLLDGDNLLVDGHHVNRAV